MTLIVLVGIIGWVVPTLAGIWFLVAFREMRDEIRTIRRYLQALYEKEHRK